MDWLQFIASFEWPVVAGVAIYLVRKPLGRMLEGISPTKVDAWGFKAEFERTLAKVEQLTPPMEPDPGKPLRSEQWGLKRLRIEAAPEVAILRAWTQLENAIQEAYFAKRPTKVGPMSVRPRIRIDARSLGTLGLTEDEIAAVGSLRELRNRVAHSENANVSHDDAGRFEEVADRLRARVQEIGKTPGTDDP